MYFEEALERVVYHITNMEYGDTVNICLDGERSIELIHTISRVLDSRKPPDAVAYSCGSGDGIQYISKDEANIMERDAASYVYKIYDCVKNTKVMLIAFTKRPYKLFGIEVNEAILTRIMGRHLIYFIRS